MSLNDLLPKTSLLLILDFDGTLVPIAPTPSGIHVPPHLPRIFDQLADKNHQIVVLSGRALEDLQQYVNHQAVQLIGHHGLEWQNETPPLRHPELHRVKQFLSDLSKQVAGSMIEDKGLSIAFHTRRCTDTHVELAQREIQGFMQELLELNLLAGKCFLEVRPKEASKAQAATRLLHAYPDLFPVCIGDDTTDEEAFAVVNTRGLTIRVGDNHFPTCAQRRLKNSDAVLRFLLDLCTDP